MEELLKDKHEEIAAIIVEPLMQGAGGMITMPKGYLKGYVIYVQNITFYLLQMR